MTTSTRNNVMLTSN